MKYIVPPRLKPGSHLRVIAPSLSMSIISKEVIDYATAHIEQMGFTVSFGKHVYEIDQFQSSSIESRLQDLHDAFEDKSVHGILAAIGGYNCNQLLPHINWDLIAKNPKVFCGYSDITILQNAMLVKTGLVGYYGPHFSTFGQKLLDSYHTDYFLKATSQAESFFVQPALYWTNDRWYQDQDTRNAVLNHGYWVLQQGSAQGTGVGGHLGTMCLLSGTPWAPSLAGTILLIEEDAEPANPCEFDRRLESLLQQKDADKIAGVLIGRFEQCYGMTRDKLAEIIKRKKVLSGKPVIANVDFGHTEPHCTLPIGGMIKIQANGNQGNIEVVQA